MDIEFQRKALKLMENLPKDDSYRIALKTFLNTGYGLLGMPIEISNFLLLAEIYFGKEKFKNVVEILKKYNILVLLEDTDSIMVGSYIPDECKIELSKLGLKIGD